ncbi:hypothetical protein Acor_63180 [Acrocarpospora corrugata]|uniref:Uncharacterized protein n=1 Tax=Acrocarpospora corrugata TaxID=35763 RepID=A0A5M3W7N9_9ACTN|nr:hypothetical protein Acor_63180 [Acrocarpospora corrugata]
MVETTKAFIAAPDQRQAGRAGAAAKAPIPALRALVGSASMRVSRGLDGTVHHDERGRPQRIATICDQLYT